MDRMASFATPACGRCPHPYRIGKDGTREEVLEAYERDLRAILSDEGHDGFVRDTLLYLCGKTLAC